MENIRFPLPLYEFVRIGNLQSKDDVDFDIIAGLSKELVAELKKKSLDESDARLQKNTSDRLRFGEGSYEEWYAKKRTPFALIEHKTDALAALAWFGPKPLGRKSLKYLSETERQEESKQKEDAWHTIVYRSYPPFRGKGLMTPFVREVIRIYMEHYPEAKLWVGMNADNEASA